MTPELRRSLGLFDAVVIGLGSMIGAGIFVALGPAAGAAGSGAGLLWALGLAAVVAYCNAMSSARLAARYPASGGTYVYGRERLGSFWGYLAGWAFVVGKTASCAAMALTVGAYVWPEQAHAVAVAAVVALTAVNYRGVQKSALLTRVIVAAVLALLACVVTVSFRAGGAGLHALGGELVTGGVLQAAGLLFFAFAGYARIATLGEEVRDPARTIPRAVPLALGLTLVVYALVAVSVLTVLGPAALAASPAPLADAARAADADWLVPLVTVGAAVAALGSLLSLILGVSRTTLAMARDGHLPTALAAVHPRFRVPHRAELAVGAVVAVVAAVVDVRGAIGFSSFGVLAYYGIANASAWTLGGRARHLSALGLTGCLALAFALPTSSVLAGSGVLAAGVVSWSVSRGRGVPPRA
ncbi:APC family permease [Streptomyces sp. NPDC017868]|uniref:APC family permease n=1 Tax=unclassified Streptomyces TaxID=2593676 RepID=UPI0037B95020